MDKKSRGRRVSPYQGIGPHQGIGPRASDAESHVVGALSTEDFFDCKLENEESKVDNSVREKFAEYLDLLSESVRAGVVGCVSNTSLIKLLAVLGSERRDERANDILRSMLINPNQ